MGDITFTNPDWIEDSEWPFDLTDERLESVNDVLPGGYQYVRRSFDGQTGYYLLKMQDEYSSTGESDGSDDWREETWTTEEVTAIRNSERRMAIRQTLTAIFGHNPQANVSDLSADRLLKKLRSTFDDEVVDNAVIEARWGSEYTSQG